MFNTEKVDLFQANKAQEGAKVATGRTVNDVFFATCCNDFETSRLDNVIDIEISNSGKACLEISKSPTAATAAGGLKNLIIDGPPCSSTTNSLVTMVKSNKSFPFVKKKRL